VRVGIARLFGRTSCSLDKFVFIFGAETSVKFESAVENRRRRVVSSTSTDDDYFIIFLLQKINYHSKSMMITMMRFLNILAA
jgi:hypothetical protein